MKFSKLDRYMSKACSTSEMDIQLSLLQNDKILSYILGVKNGTKHFFLLFRAIARNLAL